MSASVTQQVSSKCGQMVVSRRLLENLMSQHVLYWPPIQISPFHFIHNGEYTFYKPEKWVFSVECLYSHNGLFPNSVKEKTLPPKPSHAGNLFGTCVHIQINSKENQNFLFSLTSLLNQTLVLTI